MEPLRGQASTLTLRQEVKMRRCVRKLEEENTALKGEVSCFLRAIKRRIEENDGLRKIVAILGANFASERGIDTQNLA
jgi:hypothetical protein